MPVAEITLPVTLAVLGAGFLHALWNALLKSGVYVNIALPPGTPNKQCLLRCSVSAAHTDADIDRIISLFDSVVAQGHGKRALAG